MPIPIPCKCGKQLKVKDELAGKNIRCPGCKELHRVPGGERVPESPIQPELTARDLKKRGRKWRTSKLGMTLVLYGWCSWGAGVGIVLLTFTLLSLSILTRTNLGLGLLINRPVGILVAVLILAGEVAALGGYGLCIFVPKKTRARIWISAALGSALLKIALRIVAFLANSDEGETWFEANRGLLLFAAAFSMVEWVLLLIFLRMIAYHRYATWLMRGITKLIFLAVGTTFCMALLYLWMAAAVLGVLIDDSTRMVFPNAFAFACLVFCSLAGYVIFRQLILLQEGRFLVVQAADGIDPKQFPG